MEPHFFEVHSHQNPEYNLDKARINLALAGQIGSMRYVVGGIIMRSCWLVTLRAGRAKDFMRVAMRASCYAREIQNDTGPVTPYMEGPQIIYQVEESLVQIPYPLETLARARQRLMGKIGSLRYQVCIYKNIIFVYFYNGRREDMEDLLKEAGFSWSSLTG